MILLVIKMVAEYDRRNLVITKESYVLEFEKKAEYADTAGEKTLRKRRGKSRITSSSLRG